MKYIGSVALKSRATNIAIAEAVPQVLRRTPRSPQYAKAARMIQHSIHWPIVVLDFEASALDPQSYPIEVGVASCLEPGATITTWSSLIRPTVDWVNNGIWFASAQSVHGIDPCQLIRAPDVYAVMERLNEEVSGAVVLSDNPNWETFWLSRLAAATGIQPVFRVEGFVEHLKNAGVVMRQRIATFLAHNKAPHRAGPDALLLVQAIAHAVQANPAGPGP